VILTLVLIPLLDVLVILEPVFLNLFNSPDLVTIWHWLRIPVTLVIPVAGFMYARSGKREWLGVVARVSYAVFVSLILWFAFDLALERAHMREMQS
jgi:hypothetical protein